MILCFVNQSLLVMYSTKKCSLSNMFDICSITLYNAVISEKSQPQPLLKRIRECMEIHFCQDTKFELFVLDNMKFDFIN